MAHSLSRRHLLTAVAAGVAGVALSPLIRAAREPSLGLLALGKGLWQVQGGAAPVIVADSGQDLLLVEGGVGAGGRALRRLLAGEFPGRRIATVFNTHWHWDRTGANETLAIEGATIVAHENTRLWLGTEIRDPWGQRVYPPRPLRALPNQTFFYGSNSLEFAGQGLEYGYLPQAHTDGDLYVYFPRQDVLVAGDVVSDSGYPVVDAATNGWLGGMLGGLKTLLGRCTEGTRVIGSGATPVGRAQLAAQQDLCFDVLTRIGQSYYKGETWQQFLASSPTRAYDVTHGDPVHFLRTAYDSAWNHVNEIRRVTR
jgi:glyoxylase-like metal-dependent hydrolase (beta-lactamase superfamily II)